MESLYNAITATLTSNNQKKKSLKCYHREVKAWQKRHNTMPFIHMRVTTKIFSTLLERKIGTKTCRLSTSTGDKDISKLSSSRAVICPSYHSPEQQDNFNHTHRALLLCLAFLCVCWGEMSRMRSAVLCFLSKCYINSKGATLTNIKHRKADKFHVYWLVCAFYRWTITRAIGKSEICEEHVRESCVWKPERDIRRDLSVPPVKWHLGVGYDFLLTHRRTFDLLLRDNFYRLHERYINLPLRFLNRPSSVSGRWRQRRSTKNQTWETRSYAGTPGEEHMSEILERERKSMNKQVIDWHVACCLFIN